MVARHDGRSLHVFRDAARSGDLRSLKRASEAGGVVKKLWKSDRVDINARGHPLGTTALMDAAAAGHQHIVEYLLSKKADVRIRDYNGRTALHYAVLAGSYSAPLTIQNTLVQALIIRGADINAPDWNGVTALGLASENNNVSAAYTLGSAGARKGPASESDNIKQLPKISESIKRSDAISESMSTIIIEFDIENHDEEEYHFIDSPEFSVTVDESDAHIDELPFCSSRAMANRAGKAFPRRQRRTPQASFTHAVEIEVKTCQ